MYKHLFIILNIISNAFGIALVGKPLVHAYPCKSSNVIAEHFEIGRSPEEENQFGVGFNPTDFDKQYVNGLNKLSKLDITLDTTDAKIVLRDPVGRITSTFPRLFKIQFYNETSYVSFKVIGQRGKPVPNIIKMQLDFKDMCPDGFKTGFWDSMIVGEKTSAVSAIEFPRPLMRYCGRSKIDRIELIVSGQNTKYGDWPWHAAIYRTESVSSAQKYICGGTLLSKTVVLTAGHCVTIRGVKVVPERLFVVLGKYNLQGGDDATQEKNVYEIVVHEQFTSDTLKNDIAILKLSTEVEYGFYVQPICLWNKNDIDKRIIEGQLGTVVGWGLNENDVNSDQLRFANMPVANDFDCLKSYPDFFDKFLTEETFCAGARNGTSACNGDSGGGMYFQLTDEDNLKTWHLRGITSVSVRKANHNTCDPYNYVVFTDVAKYLDWIEINLQ